MYDAPSWHTHRSVHPNGGVCPKVPRCLYQSRWEVGLTDQVKHEIDTQDIVTVKLRHQRKSFFDKKHIAAEVEKLRTFC